MTGRRAPKLAERIALEIRGRIHTQSPPPGTTLGTEADLLSQYGASRCTMREAIAILERDGVVEVRRGRGGGMFVAEPDMLALGRAMRGYFELLDVTIEENIGARGVLHKLAIRLAVERATWQDVPSMRHSKMSMRHSKARFYAVLRATQNPILDIFSRAAQRFEVLALLRSTVTQQEYFTFLSEVHALQERQTEAIIGGDLQLALDLEDENLDHGEAFMRFFMDRQCKLTQQELAERLALMIGQQRPLKKPEVVTYAILNDIVELGWPAGHHLGAEQEMLVHYNVGRSVFREAIRPMEQDGIVEMRTGRKSGLKIAAPSFEKIRADSLERFERIGAPAASYRETYDALGAAIAATAASRGPSPAEPDDATGNPDVAARMERLIDGAGGNRILSTMIRILKVKATPAAIGGEAGMAVLAAIDAGDRALAHRAFLSMRTAR